MFRDSCARCVCRLRASRSCDEAASPGDEGVKRVEVFEMGPVDIYVAIVPSDTTISMSMAGYVSDLIVELARLHRIPFFSNPRVLCEGRQFPPLTPLHLLPRRRMVQVHFDPLPPLSSLRQLHHGHNVVCARDLARFGGLARTSRCAVGLNGNLLRGSIRLPFHRHAPIQELEIVELAVSSSVDTAGNVGTMIPIEQANDGDDSDERASAVALARTNDCASLVLEQTLVSMLTLVPHRHPDFLSHF